MRLSFTALQSVEPATPKRVSLSDVGREPYRLFFPAGIIAGLIGVGLWPAYFGGLTEFYPGMLHARIMASGFFGAFIFGFLGTAMPRMLSAKPLGIVNVLLLLGIHTAMVLAYATTRVAAGDVMFLALIVGFVSSMASRAAQRKDLPPPGFVLVGLAFLCVTTGAVLSVVQQFQEEPAFFWTSMQRLLSYQGFILLPILGIGPFLLPRFFGMQSAHDFPESLKPSANWLRKAIGAFVAGALIIASFWIEASGSFRLAYGLRFATTLIYLLVEFPLRKAPNTGSSLGVSIRIALAGLVIGFLFVALFPAYRIGLLHLTLVGGFSVMTFVVATRVVFGHSGNLEKLKGRNRWLMGAVGLMLLGMATRISGDFWPKILPSHYVYGAGAWMAGVLLWAFKVLPYVLFTEDED